MRRRRIDGYEGVYRQGGISCEVIERKEEERTAEG